MKGFRSKKKTLFCSSKFFEDSFKCFELRQIVEGGAIDLFASLQRRFRKRFQMLPCLSSLKIEEEFRRWDSSMVEKPSAHQTAMKMSPLKEDDVFHEQGSTALTSSAEVHVPDQQSRTL